MTISVGSDQFKNIVEIWDSGPNTLGPSARPSGWERFAGPGAPAQGMAATLRWPIPKPLGQRRLDAGVCQTVPDRPRNLDGAG
jgi:hypothetical protein